MQQFENSSALKEVHTSANTRARALNWKYDLRASARILADVHANKQKHNEHLAVCTNAQKHK